MNRTEKKNGNWTCTFISTSEISMKQNDAAPKQKEQWNRDFAQVSARQFAVRIEAIGQISAQFEIRFVLGSDTARTLRGALGDPIPSWPVRRNQPGYGGRRRQGQGNVSPLIMIVRPNPLFAYSTDQVTNLLYECRATSGLRS
ncbi:50S ribosomal protein L29 [Striga asiatica]|uniref:50S ribosomal protein L29 n=1 Tax=Striga asiatica TaxID=4170 RepID=A0A5A7RB29_STRAF|nr:50S ribosomal protein L29 [Striga asiatica]